MKMVIIYDDDDDTSHITVVDRAVTLLAILRIMLPPGILECARGSQYALHLARVLKLSCALRHSQPQIHLSCSRSMKCNDRYRRSVNKI